MRILNIVSMVASMIVLSGCRQEQSKPYTIVIDGSTLTNNLSWWETRKLEGAISSAIDTVTERLRIEYRDTLRAYVFDSDQGNEGGGNRIYLTRESAADNYIVLHEVTHAIAPMEASGFYLEGLAMMMDMISLPLTERDTYVHRQIGNDREKMFPIKFLMENDSIYCKQHSHETAMGYVEAGSFLTYLVTLYGWDTMRDQLNGRVKDYEAVYGKSLDELEIEWLETIFPSPSKDTLVL